MDQSSDHVDLRDGARVCEASQGVAQCGVIQSSGYQTGSCGSEVGIEVARRCYRHIRGSHVDGSALLYVGRMMAISLFEVKPDDAADSDQ